MKLITEIWTLAQTAGFDTGRLSVRVGTLEGINDPILWTAATYTDDGLKADLMVSGRYISLELLGQQNAAWRLNSLDVDYEPGGLW
jgi:hypothetical protein